MQRPGRQGKPAAPPPEHKDKGADEQIRSTELAMDRDGPPLNEEYGQHKDRRKAKTETAGSPSEAKNDG